MDMHPALTTVIYILIAVVFVAIVTYMILYNRGMRSKKAAQLAKGRLPASQEEGISIATEGKEKAGRTGTIN